MSTERESSFSPFADEFRTLISTPQVDMRDNTGTNRVTANHTDAPIYWIRGAKVADNYADFYDGNWDSHEPRFWDGNRAIGTGVNGSFVIWSGSNADGTGDAPYRAGEAQVRLGEHLPGNEIHSGVLFPQGNNTAFHGLSPVFTVAPARATALALTTLEIGPASANNALIPAFDPEIFNYRVVVRQGTTITVRAIDSTDFSFITVNGFELPFNSRTSAPIAVPDSGETIITILLAATNGATTTYTLTATRRPASPPPPARYVLDPGSVITPPGLVKGDVFRLMFVDGIISGSSGNISDYNAEAQRVANNGAMQIRPFSGSFRALVSTTGVDMRDNTATNRITADHPDAPIYWLTGQKIADNYAALYDGGWDSVEFRDRNGGIQRTDIGIWTGSNQDGTGAIGHEVGTSEPVAGVAATHDALYNRGFPYAAAGRLHFIYALSPVLVVGRDTLYSLNLTQADGTEVVLSPAFSPAITTYNAAIASTVDEVTVTAEASYVDSTTVVSVAGAGGAGGSGTTVQVPAGDSTFVVTVTSTESLTTTTYTVNLSRRTTPPPAAPVAQSLPKNSLLVPSELNVGEQFRLMFINPSSVTGRRLDIDDVYNDAVQTTAADGHTDIREFSNQFRVLLSTYQLDARENTATTGTGIPIYWLGGDRVADDYADFYDGSWASHAPHDKDGNALTAAGLVMMTGSNADGSGDFGFEINRNPIRVGRLDQGEGAELHAETSSNREFRQMYAMSPLITVAEANTALSSLAVRRNGGTEDLIIAPHFDPGITSYAASVSNDITTLLFTPTVHHANASATIGATSAGETTADTLTIASDTDKNIPLNEGLNLIRIVVTSTLNSVGTTTYTLSVTRLGVPPPVPAGMHTTLLAGSPLVPPEVPVGAQFRLLFVGDTATAQNGALTFYNNRVANSARNGAADIRPFSDQFRALASSVTVDARDNTGTHSEAGGGDVPIYWVGGDKVADNYADFYDNSWDSRAARDPSGNALDTTGLIIMTGSLENGIGQSTTRFGDCCNGGNGIRVGRLDDQSDQGEGAEIDDGPIRDPGNTRFTCTACRRW